MQPVQSADGLAGAVDVGAVVDRLSGQGVASSVHYNSQGCFHYVQPADFWAQVCNIPCGVLLQCCCLAVNWQHVFRLSCSYCGITAEQSMSLCLLAHQQHTYRLVAAEQAPASRQEHCSTAVGW